MNTDMFCFQCEQTMGGKGCTLNGVCGKKAATANRQDELTGVLISLAVATKAKPEEITLELTQFVVDSLFTTVTNVNFDDASIDKYIARGKNWLAKYGVEKIFDLQTVWTADEDIRSLKSLILFGLRGMAAYASHARVLNCTDPEVDEFFFSALAEIALTDDAEQLLNVTIELGRVNCRCMELLDHANTDAYGVPTPVEVPLTIAKGPFIVISGHDLKDLELLLKQTADKGVNVCTHGEMLPAHGYPELRKYPHFKGHFGTAWFNQQREFAGVPAAFLFTTNCIMRPLPSYADNVFTTGLVRFPGVVHIGEDKDFSPVIAKALALGGYAEDTLVAGGNGGKVVTTGFNWRTVLSLADKIVAAVKSGAIRKFYLVGGCDGCHKERGYYTDFVKATPADTVVLTCACGKFRFNDLDLGEIDGIPRLIDVGQCNDAYGAVRIALALAQAFGCSVNELPLTLNISWYEQKAVCILLTLLALGIKNIKLGPTLPAFVSPNILDKLVKNFNIAPISTVENDL